MPPSDDEELRTLQHRAYGRDGGLTDAEAARLRELEEARSARAEADGAHAVAHVREENPRPGGGIGAEGPPERANSSRAHAVGAAERDAADPVGDGAVEQRAPSSRAAGVSDAAMAPGGARRAIRRYWKAVAAGSAALVVIGLAAGWLLFGRHGLPSAVPAGQQEALAMIEKRDYDAGSVRFVGEEHGVAVWRATMDGGTRECIVITHEQHQGSQCRVIGEPPMEYGVDGLSTSVEFEEDGETVMVWASIILDIEGEPATIVQRSVMSAENWESQYTPEELEAAERLETEGFERWSLQIVGYDGELAVWQAQRSGETCLAAVIEGEVHLGCGDTNVISDRLQLRIGATEYEVVQTANRGLMFSIIRHAAPSDGSADPLELGGEHGDPIEVTPETPEP